MAYRFVACKAVDGIDSRTNFDAFGIGSAALLGSIIGYDGAS
jgi:hypothetical protein